MHIGDEPGAGQQHPKIAFIGAGRLASTLTRAFDAAGVPVVAVASRSLSSASVLAASISNCRVYERAQDAADAADLVLITVPDDAIASVAAHLRVRAGQGVVHCSGATEVAVLDPVIIQGGQAGGFHPLQLFSDPLLALEHVRGSSVGIEAPEPLQSILLQLAACIGYQPLALPPGVRGRYHAATGYAASFMLSLLREACDIWATLGWSEQQSMAALLPLARGTIETARVQGLAGALSGPVSRGDVQVLERHLRDLQTLGPDAVAFYRTLAIQQLRLARERGRLDQATLDAMAAAMGITT